MEGTGDFLLFNTIPFAEDIRDYIFPSFFTLAPKLQPSDAQLTAAENLIKSMDLAPLHPPGLPHMLQTNPVVKVTLHTGLWFRV